MLFIIFFSLSLHLGKRFYISVNQIWTKFVLWNFNHGYSDKGGSKCFSITWIRSFERVHVGVFEGALSPWQEVSWIGCRLERNSVVLRCKFFLTRTWCCHLNSIRILLYSWLLFNSFAFSDTILSIFDQSHSPALPSPWMITRFCMMKTTHSDFLGSIWFVTWVQSRTPYASNNL